MRPEKRKSYLIRFLACILALIAPIAYLRVLAGAGSLLQIDLVQVFDGTHTISDRSGTLLYDGECLEQDTVGNLVGTEGLIANSLYNRYKDEMIVSGFNPLVGRDSLQGTSMQTTLMPLADQIRIKNLYGSYDGACFAYNYETGEVYIALSLPCGLGAGLREGSMFNGCLDGTYVPASTMKILTTICAVAQNPDLVDFEFTCQKSLMLDDGNIVNCHDYHGKIDLSDALGHSCNCYMAALIQKLNVKETSRILAQLGILNKGTEAVEDSLRGVMDKLSYAYGHTEFTSFKQFQSVWGLIGQGDTRANPVNMAMVAAAVANGGSVAQPYIMESIVNHGTKVAYEAPEAQTLTIIDASTARMVKMAWEIAVKDHYHNGAKPLDEVISLAKTGTAEEDGGINDRLLLGVMEAYKTAFFIIVEDSSDNNGLVFAVANLLAETVGALQQ